MAQLSAEQTAQILYQAGFRGQDLIHMTAIAKRESGYKADAHRTDRPGQQRTGDFGLFQVNYTNFDMLIAAGIMNSPQDLFDPVVNARAAKHLFDKSGLFPWSMAPGGWNANGNPLYGVNVGAAEAAVNGAAAAGLLGVDWGGQTQTQAQGGQAPVSNAPAPNAPVTIPSDADMIRLHTGGVLAVFDVGGVLIQYQVPGDGSVTIPWERVRQVSEADWHNTYIHAVDGGSANELGSVSTDHGTFKAFWDTITGQVMGYTNPAKDDPGVKKVIAEFAARPDMTPQELQNRLQATTWYQGRSTSELEWNGLADGEKVKRRDDMAARMAQTWLQYTGENVALTDPRIQNYVEELTSGKQGFGSWTEKVVKTQALANGESPYSRQMRDEERAQRQEGVDVENTAAKVRSLSQRWGVQLSEGTIQQWGREIVDKTKSDDDLLESLKNQAMILFPWKDREMETEQAAAPWLETYRRVMEKPGTLFTADVQKALSAGKPVFEFETELKKSGGWLETKNARSELASLAAEAGQRMGFGG